MNIIINFEILKLQMQKLLNMCHLNIYHYKIK